MFWVKIETAQGFWEMVKNELHGVTKYWQKKG